MYRSSSTIVVGADTLLRERLPHGWKSASSCKIKKAGTIYVAISGFEYEPHNGFSAYRLASAAIANSRGVVASAKRFEALSHGPFQEAVRFERSHDPDLYKSEIEGKPEALSILFMAIEKTIPTIAAVTYTLAENSHQQVLAQSSIGLCPGDRCPPVGEGLEGFVFTTLGQHEAVDRISNEQSFPLDLKSDPISTIRRLIRAEISDVPEYVGPPIDILTISTDGEKWNQNGKCPYRQQHH